MRVLWELFIFLALQCSVFTFASDNISSTNLNALFQRERHSVFHRYARSAHSGWTCNMYLQADHKLYEEIFHNEGKWEHERTLDVITTMLHSHVRAVNAIYEKTNFNGIKGISFAAKRISIYKPDDCTRNQTDNPFCEEDIDASHLLDLTSRQNHSAFCLSYVFTYRDFKVEKGAELGLAWEAGRDKVGGVCHVHQLVKDGYRSLNTGLVTLASKGRRISPRISQLTVAHEIGHNLGASHDDEEDCQGLPEGNYLMHASSSSGEAPNNSKLSRCAIQSIAAVLKEIRRLPHSATDRGYRRNCFTDASSSFCGDGIVDGDEQCDCGFAEKDCRSVGDKCCNWREDQNRFKGCTRKPGAACSPSEGVCCNQDNCQFKVAGGGQECAAETECSFSSTCNGHSAKCPAAIPKEDGLLCEDGTKVCKQGICSESVCEKMGLKDCLLINCPSETYCYLACEKNGVCTSTLDLPEFGANLTRFVQRGREGLTGFALRIGTACNNGRGKCNADRQCGSVDSDGALKRLWNKTANFFSSISSALF